MKAKWSQEKEKEIIEQIVAFYRYNTGTIPENKYFMDGISAAIKWMRSDKRKKIPVIKDGKLPRLVTST